MKLFRLFFFLLCVTQNSLAQDHFIGNWQLQQNSVPNTPPVYMQLVIGSPQYGVLYPATLRLSCDSFKASYQLLLVKRNSRQLAISRNKFPVHEYPFSIGNIPITLNGYFDFSRDIKGNLTLFANRIPAKKYGITLTDTKGIDPAYTSTANRILNFFQYDSLKLIKKNPDGTEPFIFSNEGNATEAIYYGVLDSIHVTSKDGLIAFKQNNDNDLISILHNGKKVVDQVDSKKKRPEEEILLDTGMNLICFFADDYGKKHPSGAAIKLSFGNQSQPMDFSHPMNLGATFMVAPVFYEKGEENDNQFRTLLPTNPGQQQGSNPNYLPRASNEHSLERNNKLVGSLVTKSRQITLAIWDDALEDGDSISLSINGKWITQGLPVKNKPQFLYVSLDPGPNSITFVADNLGNVVPNTSVLEIIDGKKRKSFMIDTDLNKNNQVNIYYEVQPDP